MKIAIVRKKYTFHGGAEGFSQGLISLLAEQGHEVHIHAIQWDGDSPHINILFHKVPAIKFNSLLRDLSFAVMSVRGLKNGHYDIIQTHDKTLYQDIYRAGDGCHIEWLRQRWKRTGPAGRLSILLNPYHWLVLGLERAIFRGHRFRKVIAISEMVRKDIIRHYRVPDEDIVVIYNPVDLERFHPANKEKYRQNIRREYGVADNELVVLFVGSGFERKGVRYLIEAAGLLDSPVTVMVAGKGKPEAFSDLIKNQKVIFCGPRKQIEQYYAAADAFVLPTIYEPFGNVHLEALASGLPVITTGNSGAAEVIQHGKSGFVVQDPGDAVSIADCLRQFLDRERLASMGAEARRTAELFTFRKYSDEITRLYSDIMEKKSGSQRSGR